MLRVPRRFLADPDVEWSRVTLRFHRSGEDGALGPLAGHAALRTDPRSERASLGLEFSAVLQAGRYTAAVHPFGHLHSFELVQGAEELLIDVQELFRTTIRVDDLPGEGPPSLDAALDHGTHGRIRVGLVPHEPGGHRAVTVAGVLAIRAASSRGAVLEESLSVREDAEVVLRLDQRWSLRVTWEGPAMPDPGWWSGLRARSVVDAQARPPALRFRTRIGSADEVSAASWSFEQPGPFELLVPATGGSRLSSRIVPMEPGQRRYEVRLGGDG